MKIGNQGDGGGRPQVVFDKDQVLQYEQLAAVLNKGQIADFFNVSETTLREVEKRQPEVSEAYKKGRSNAIASVGSNLIQMAQKGNTTAAIFYLKTQAGWSENNEEETESPSFAINVESAAPVGEVKITRGRKHGA